MSYLQLYDEANTSKPYYEWYKKILSVTEVVKALELLGGAGTINQIAHKMEEMGILGNMHANVKGALVSLKNRDLVNIEIGTYTGGMKPMVIKLK